MVTIFWAAFMSERAEVGGVAAVSPGRHHDGLHKGDDGIRGSPMLSEDVKHRGVPPVDVGRGRWRGIRENGVVGHEGGAEREAVEMAEEANWTT